MLGDFIDEKTEQEIELKLFTDDEFAEQLLICEDELIDDFLLGRLTEKEMFNLKMHFLTSSEMREKLQFARFLRAYLAEQKLISV